MIKKERNDGDYNLAAFSRLPHLKKAYTCKVSMLPHLPFLQE